MQVAEGLQQGLAVRPRQMRREVGLVGLRVLEPFGEGIGDVLHDEVEEGALFLLHEEGVVQADDISVLDLLQDVELAVLVLLVLKDVLHGVELL